MRLKSEVPSEHDECKNFWTWAQYQPVLKDYLIHIPNEGKRSPQYGSSLKKIGMRRGIPDYFLPVRNERYIGLWIEMKRVNYKPPKNHTEQDNWLSKLRLQGYFACFCQGWDDAANCCLAYLENDL